MRAWFLGVSEELSKCRLTSTPNLTEWCNFIKDVMIEMGRVLKKGSRAVIEVGEVSVGFKK